MNRRIALAAAILLTGCTTVGTISNPACLIFCKENSSTTITTHKETQIEKPSVRNPS